MEFLDGAIAWREVEGRHLVLYTSLTGEAEPELEHAPIEAINSDKGIDFILETLRQPMEQKQIFQKHKFLSDFEGIQRQPGEGLKAFSNRYRRIERNLKVLVGSRYSLAFEDVAESMAMQFPDFKGAPPVIGRDGQPISRHKGGGKGQAPTSSGHAGKGGGSKRGGFTKKVYVAEQADEGQADQEPQSAEGAGEDDNNNDDHADHEDGGDDEGELDNEEAPDLAEVAEVLSVTARKLAGMKLGRKFSGVPERTTNCVACGEKGHWKGDPQCPVSGKGAAAQSGAGNKGQDSSGKGAKKGAHQTYMVRHADHGSIEVTDDVAYGAMFTVNVVFDVRRAPGGDLGFPDMMILDTACQRTCCGVNWASAHTSSLRGTFKCTGLPAQTLFSLVAATPSRPAVVCTCRRASGKLT